MKCYLCNRELVDRDCVTDKETQGIIHKEHIIPDALHGRLCSTTILCEECGSKLGKAEDAGFVELFFYIANLLKGNGLATAHGNKGYHKLQGKLYPNPNNLNNYIPIRMTNDGKVYAKDNTYRIDDATKTITIYLCTNRNDKLIESVKKRIIEERTDIDISSYTYIIFDEISSEYLGWYFSEGNQDFNKYFAKGLQKIATEYALDCGVPKEQLSNVLVTDSDTGKSKMIEEVECIPFSPCSYFDCIFENYRHIWEREFPTHTLILFDHEVAEHNRWLYCYVDLFSTFQFYVVLSKNYAGEPIQKTYYQRILKNENEPMYIDNTWSNSDIDIVVRELGLTYDSLPENRDNLIESVNKAIKERERINQRPNISFALYKDLKVQSSKIQKDLLQHLLHKQTQYVDKQMFQQLDYSDFISIQQEIEVQVLEGRYRMLHEFIDGNKYSHIDMPKECMNTWKNNPDVVKAYATQKMNNLLMMLK